MQKVLAFFLSAALAMPGVAAAKASAPISLAKTSKWEINYDEDSCHLAAQFGSGKEAATLFMIRRSPSDWLELQLFGKMLDYGGIEMPMEIAFGGQAVPFKRVGISVKSTGAGKQPGVIVEGMRVDGWQFPAKSTTPVQMPKLTEEAEKAVSSVTFKAPGQKPYRLETGSLGAPMAAMRTCTEDLLVHWGFDPKVQAALTKSAAPASNPGGWLRSSDFPPAALNNGHNGLVRFRLDVEPSGEVSRCRILYRTNPDDFADLSCKLLMSRAKMTAALDSGGKPVRSFYIGQVKWMAGEW